MYARWMGFVGSLLTLVLVGSGVLGVATQGVAKAAGPAACTELILNGGFESGATSWEVTTNGPYALVSAAFPHTGQSGAILGARDSAVDELGQAITVPAATTATLRFWWYMLTEETDADVWDRLDATIAAPASPSPVRLLRITDNSVPGSWQQASIDISTYAGQSIRLAFRATTDSDRPTDFYLDDVSLEACAGAAATPTATVSVTPTATATVITPASDRTYLPLVTK